MCVVGIEASCDLWGWRERGIGSAFNIHPYARTWGYALLGAPLQPRLNCTPTPHASRMQRRQPHASAGRTLHIRIVSDQFSQPGALYVYVTACQYEAQAAGLHITAT